jgi:3-hydroxyisobutyrate dehydrogenase-like beta-hydroxyacid dehydrogenase
MKTIGVIGLGIIGSVWAKHYANAGVLAGVWNRTPQADFPHWLSSPEAVAKAADVIQIVVADPPAVLSVLERIAPLLTPEKIVVQSSTIDPESSEQFRQLVTARGAGYLEAPFTGSKPAAEEKKSVYYFGGDSAVIAEVAPLLSLVSENRFVIGTNKQAASLKLAMNLNIAAQMQGLAEALTMARLAGVSDDIFFTVLSKNVGYSGLTRLKEPKLRAADFSPQFSVKHLLKDLRLASRTNECEDFPLLDTLRDCLHAASANGLADEDFSAIIKLLRPAADR